MQTLVDENNYNYKRNNKEVGSKPVQNSQNPASIRTNVRDTADGVHTERKIEEKKVVFGSGTHLLEFFVLPRSYGVRSETVP